MAATKSDRAATLVAMLERNALAHPDRLAYRFLSYTSPTGFAAHQEDLDFREVYERVERIAAHLGEVAAPGDRALLLLKSDPDFLIGFLACLRAGVIAVPVAHPERRPGLVVGRRGPGRYGPKTEIRSSAGQPEREVDPLHAARVDMPTTISSCSRSPAR